MAPYGQAAPGYGAQPGVMGTLPSAGVSGSGPTRRNALMTFLIPVIIMFGGAIVGVILGIILALISPALGLLGSLIALAAVCVGGVIAILSTIKMIGELNVVTRNAAFPWWPMIVPIYGLIWMWFQVPAEVAKAKQMMGAQTPPRSTVLYVFLFHYALASDINDLVRQ